MKKGFKLPELPKSTIYRVPDGYFDKLPGVVMARVTAEQPAFSSNRWSSIFYLYRAALASIFLVVGFVAAFLFSNNPSDSSNYSSTADLSAISQQETLEYVLLQDNLESGDLIDLNLADNDVSAEFINATTADILETVDEQQLEEVYFN